MRSGGVARPPGGSEGDEEEAEWQSGGGDRGRSRGAFWHEHDHEDVEVELLDNDASEDSLATAGGDKGSRATNGEYSNRKPLFPLSGSLLTQHFPTYRYTLRNAPHSIAP